MTRPLFRLRELLIGAGAYIASNNALCQKSAWSGHMSETIDLELLHFTVNH